MLIAAVRITFSSISGSSSSTILSVMGRPRVSAVRVAAKCVEEGVGENPPNLFAEHLMPMLCIHAGGPR